MSAVPLSDVVMVDVVVVGAGPAGAAFALNLSPFHRVLLIDKAEGPASQVGESLPAAAGRLLRDMGLMKAFLAQRHEPCHGRFSAWGHQGLVRHDAMRDLDGHGWHLDRACFDAWLRAVAQERGALWWPWTHCQSIQADEGGRGGWSLLLHHGGRERRVHARMVVDASGRGASLARKLGMVRQVGDRLVCGWVRGRDRDPHGGVGGVVSEPGGWWYSAPLPRGERLLAFYTDADLPDAQDAHDRDALLRRVRGVPHLHDALEAAGFTAEGSGFCSARSEWLSRWRGPGWLAIGDAAFSFDPLSSQGIFNALYTGLLAAEISHRELAAGRSGTSAVTAFPDWAGYERALSRIHAAYREHSTLWYRQESRWSDQPFWRRRWPRPDPDGAHAPPGHRPAQPAWGDPEGRALA